MNKLPDTSGNYETALANAEKGIVSIPIAPGKKGIPLVKWKRWQTEMPPPELLKEWFADTRVNVAIITTGMVVFDCEEQTRAKLVLDECGDTPHKVLTPGGGIHLGYRKRKGSVVQNLVKIKGLPIDIRTDGGLEMIPNSRTEHGEYRWIGDGLRPVADLPVARISWTRERTRRRVIVSAVADGDDPHGLLYRGRRYVEKIDKAEDGKNGHTSLFVAALKIVRFVKSDRELAWQLLLHYNATRCIPPWDVDDPRALAALEHKLDEAMKKARI